MKTEIRKQMTEEDGKQRLLYVECGMPEFESESLLKKDDETEIVIQGLTAYF